MNCDSNVNSNVGRLFLASHAEWLSLATTGDGNLQDYLFAKGDRVRFVGLEKKPELNGMEGVIDSFMPVSGRFFVTEVGGVADNTVSARASNLELVSTPSECKTPLDIQGVISIFFAPGMRYIGSIQIPGDAGVEAGDVVGQRQPYEVTVMGRPDMCRAGLDADFTSDIDKVLGYEVLARHRAYGDEQYVCIRVTDVVSTAEGGVSFNVEYADGETVCRGMWHSDDMCFRGDVRQATNALDNIYHTSDPVTHTFDLYPCPEEPPPPLPSAPSPLAPPGTELCCVWSRRRHAASCCLDKCLGAFDRLMATTRPHVTIIALASGMQESQEDLLGLKWAQLFEATVSYSEELCALLRRMSAYLDKLVFDTPQERSDALKRMSERGMSRAQAHAMVDKVFQRVRNMGTTWVSCCPEKQNFVQTMLYTCHTREMRSYESLSDSLRRAEQRLTASTIGAFQLVAAQSQSGGDVASSADVDICAICMESVCDRSGGEGAGVGGEGEGRLRLPCGHIFHGPCIRTWLLNHRECPIDRQMIGDY